MEKGGDILLKRNQVFTLVTIAVMSFLIGTMSSAMATERGNPWDRVWTAITGLESRVETLEEQSLAPPGFITAPAYDSGWLVIQPAQVLTISHNLGTEEVFIYLLGKAESGYIHQITQGSHGVSVHWIHANEIAIWRHPYDEIWHQVRVQIWKIPEPD